MIDKLWFYSHGARSANMIPVDCPYAHKVRSQIFCSNQEEHDYLSSLNLMHGRDIQIDIFQEWMEIKQHALPTHLRVLPFAYSTAMLDLRGL